MDNVNPAYKTWVRALWIYALFTVPSLLDNVAIYLIAQGFAFCCSVPAVLLFALLLRGIRSLRPGSKSLGLFLSLSSGTLCTFGCAMLACFWFFRQDAWEGFSAFYMFPLAAVAAATVAILSFHRSTFRYVNPNHHVNSFPKMA